MADSSLTQVHIPPNDRAIATAVNTTLRSLGSAVGTSLSGAIIQQHLRIRLKEIAHGDEHLEHVLKDIRDSLDANKLLPPYLQVSVRDSYAEATSFVFGAQICSFMLAFCGSLGMKEIDLEE